MTRKKYKSSFKTKVVLEALKERDSLSSLAQKFDIHPQQIGLWKREFLSNVDEVFASPKKSAKTESQEKEERLLKIIGQQKVELDFLKKALS